MEVRIERERRFHNSRFAGQQDSRDRVAKYYSINRFQDECFNHCVLEACAGAKLLELGCAKGETSFFWDANGARVTGVDISETAIDAARDAARITGRDITFEVVNCEQMTEFEDESFDIVTGRGILHHLDLDRSLAEIARVLNPDGRAVFIEPLGHNPLINLFRRLTPGLRTEDEHPLLMKDLSLAKDYFQEVRAHYFHLTTLLAVPFRGTALFGSLLGGLHGFDQGALKNLPSLRKYTWTVVLEFRRPADH